MLHSARGYDFTAEAADGEAHLLRAEGVDLENPPRDVSLVLEGEAPWEATRLAHPAVVTPGLNGRAFGLDRKSVV